MASRRRPAMRATMTLRSLEVRSPTLNVKVVDLELKLERELGLPAAPVVPGQLALPMAPASIPERSAIRVRKESTPARDVSRGAGATCSECHRRGYHLASCSRRSQ